jgi:hypothetical protein
MHNKWPPHRLFPLAVLGGRFAWGGSEMGYRPDTPWQAGQPQRDGHERQGQAWATVPITGPPA